MKFVTDEKKSFSIEKRKSSMIIMEKYLEAS